MSRPKNDESLNRITGERLEREIKRKYSGKSWENDFLRDIQLAGYTISQQTISKTIKGKQSITPQKAEIYSKILDDVTVGYLMGIDPDRNDAERKTRELNEQLESMHHHIRDVESPGGAMRKEIRAFLKIINLSGHSIHISAISKKDFELLGVVPSDFMKACQLEIHSLSDPECFENFSLYSTFLYAIGIDGIEYNIIDGQFERLVHTTLQAVNDTINNLFTVASIINKE